MIYTKSLPWACVKAKKRSTKTDVMFAPEGVSWFWARSFSLRSLEGKVRNLCMLYAFLMEKNWKFLLNIKIACALGCVCTSSGSLSKKCIDPVLTISWKGKLFEANIDWDKYCLCPENMSRPKALVIRACSKKECSTTKIIFSLRGNHLWRCQQYLYFKFRFP